jgi:hypothetical protein
VVFYAKAMPSSATATASAASPKQLECPGSLCLQPQEDLHLVLIYTHLLVGLRAVDRSGSIQ